MRNADLTGRSFGRWKVIRFSYYSGPDSRHRLFWWHCLCRCGTTRDVKSASLTTGASRSCGCLQREVMARVSTRHGMSRTPEYRVWQHMKARCQKAHDPEYRNYGARGITVCKRWHSFQSFIADMGHRPSPDHSLERKNNNKGYSPDNCIWALPIVQSNNKRTNRMLEHEGKSQSITLWARDKKLNPRTISKRLWSGWSVSQALNCPAPTDKAGWSSRAWLASQ